MSNLERIEFLLQRFSDEKATLEELEELSSRLNNPQEEQLASEWLYSHLQSSSTIQGADKQRLEQILQKIHKPQEKKEKNKAFGLKRWWPAAVAAIILACIGIYQLSPLHINTDTGTEELAHAQIVPGRAGAVLHLSNGQQILLDSQTNGALVSEGNIKIIKKSGALQYIGSAKELIYNTVSTDRGRQWQLNLSDGTKVWLNAESSIRYPLSFIGKERTVEITGEAYFEVAHNAQHPFKVKVKNQIIEDLGTAFNINAYNAKVSTTLLSGSLRVQLGEESALLKPGQQAQAGKSIHLRFAVNTQAMIAWKNGLFQFDNADLPTIMQELGRWYNVSVDYKEAPGTRLFSGKIPRDMPLSDVLKILKQLGVHFEVRHNKVNEDRDGKVIVSS